MNWLKITAASGAALALLTPSALAGDIAPFDNNGDGELDRAEFAAALTAEGVLGGLDANGDGAIGADEVGPIFRIADADWNGGLEQSEYDALLGIAVAEAPEDGADEDDDSEDG